MHVTLEMRKGNNVYIIVSWTQWHARDFTNERWKQCDIIHDSFSLDLLSIDLLFFFYQSIDLLLEVMISNEL